jgi:AraC family transcriptional regulator of adaptative response/methylated-DNA-[protein]-cysteine methyltransferase
LAPEFRWRRLRDYPEMSGMKTLPSVREMERAWQARDAAYDGLFFLGVRTTGIFCRPTCPARKPLPRNVLYFSDVTEAAAAGFRACKRCRPAAADEHPPWAKELLSQIERAPEQRITEAALRARGVDPTTARRWFRKHVGMSPAAFARARRVGSAHESLRAGGKLDDAVADSGFESHSGFREAFARVFGAAPGKARARGCIVFTWLPSPVGPLVVAATDEGLCLLEFGEPARLGPQIERLRARFELPAVPGRNRHLDLAERELREYFAGKLRDFTVPVVIRGTLFQEKVWRALLRIPYGATRSYGDVARTVGSPAAVRAVGTANGSNRIAIIIPCHRVVNTGGKLGGYGGGLHRKKFLLDLEGEALASG